MTVSIDPEWLFAQDCRFVAAAAQYDQLPPLGVTEVAFAGRSNVGKSSLLNALLGRRTLVRVSSKPGSTQTVNFFDLAGRLTLVDLPGYGYARAAKTQRMDWGRLIQDYLRGRPNLRRVCLLIDARHGLKAADEETMTFLDKMALGYQLVLTKTDLVPEPARQAVLVALDEKARKHPAAHPDILMTSSESREGLGALRAALADLAG